MSYSSEVLADAPAAYWRMDEASGNIQDSSGNANHATGTEGAGSGTYAESGALASDAASKSIRFNPNFRFLVNDNVSLDLGDVFSLECWLKISSVPVTYSDFIAKQTNAYEMRLYPGLTFSLVKADVSETVVSTSAVPNDSAFHHIVATKSGATVKLYLDNVDVTGTVTNTTYADNASVLQLGGSAVDFINGWLDEIAFYPTALSAARVSVHYNAAQSAATTPTLRIMRSNLRW